MIKNLAVAILLACAITAAHAQLWSGVLAPARATDWTQAGVTGGMPAWSQCSSSGSVAPYGSSGSYASPATITAAVSANNGNSCYVLLGAGTFYLNGGIRNKGVSNVELRGMGADQTFLVFNGVSTCSGGGSQCAVSFEDNDGEYPGGVTVAAKWTGNYAQGDSTIIVNNASVLGITANQTMLVLDQADTGYSGNSVAAGGGGTSGSAVDNGGYFVCADAYNPSGPLGCDYNGPDGGGARAHRWQAEYVTVTACSPSCSNTGTTTLTISPPLIHPNWASGQAPEAWAIQASSYVGLRDFSVNMSAIPSSSGHGGVGFNNVHDFWVQGVAVANGPQSGFTLNNVLRGIVQSNYVYNAGNSSLGVDPNPADPNGIALTGEAVILQNNIIQWTRDALFVSNSSAGNVVAYNLVENCYESTTDLWPCLYDGHSAGIDYNLWEGNVAEQMAQDQTHGTHMAETFFRNFVTGWESCSNGVCGTLPTSKTSNNDAMQPLSYNRYMNAVGNVFGTHGVHDISGALYTFTNAEWFWNGTGYGHIWNIGSGNSCSPPSCAGGPIPIDSLVSSTDMWYYNWDVYNNAIMACTGTSGTPNTPGYCPQDQRGLSAPTYPGLSSPSTTLPCSFYISGCAKPSWWAASIPFPAIGPDVTGGNVGQCGGTLNAVNQFAGLPATDASQCDGQGISTAWAGHVNAIPALAAYLAHGGPPDGVGPALSFNANTWYGSTPQAATPTFLPVGGVYGSAQSVTLSTGTSGASICATTDSSAPTAPTAGTCSGGTTFTYTAPISVSGTTTINAVATKVGYVNSAQGTATYTIGSPTLGAPTYNPGGGTFLTLPSVTITPPGLASACWTTDGSTPAAAAPGTCSHGTTYVSPVTIPVTNTVLKSIATQAGAINSTETDATYKQANIVLDASGDFNGDNVMRTTATCPPITPTAGDGITVFVSFGIYSAIVSVTDDVNSGAYSAGVPMHLNSTVGQSTGVYYKSSVAGAATTITLTLSAPNNFVALACQAWKPKVGGTFTLDSAFVQQQDVTATANPNTGTAIAPTNANELILGLLSSEVNTPSSAGSGFTLLGQNPGPNMFAEYQVQSTATATNAPWVMASDNWTAQQAAFYFGSTPPPAPVNATGKLSLTGKGQTTP